LAVYTECSIIIAPILPNRVSIGIAIDFVEYQIMSAFIYHHHLRKRLATCICDLEDSAKTKFLLCRIYSA